MKLISTTIFIVFQLWAGSAIAQERWALMPSLLSNLELIFPHRHIQCDPVPEANRFTCTEDGEIFHVTFRNEVYDGIVARISPLTPFDDASSEQIRNFAEAMAPLLFDHFKRSYRDLDPKPHFDERGVSFRASNYAAILSVWATGGTIDIYYGVLG